MTSLPVTALDVERAFPGLSFTRMVALAYPDDRTDRLFLVLQSGRIMVFRDDQTVSSAETFLDIRQQVNDRGNEEGLLGLAFDPEYRANGYFYVYYSASSPRRSVISRFSASTADPDSAVPGSERIVLEVPQPYSNHNGGQIAFGPDGYLYIGLGDGGSRNDPNGNGQDRSTLLGSILRIDVSTLDETGVYAVPANNPFVGTDDGAREEIWAHGLRNPWRFTFDRLTGDLWAGDVGQNRYEEIDIVRPGLNYGWNVMEGDECFQPREGCDRTGLEPPVAVYGRNGGCSVTGGYVYRGARLPSLYGAYVYGDFCSGRIWAFRYDGRRVTEHIELVDSDLSISSFGEGRDGELYILSFDEKIYRFASP
jgi:glucose/arabinose dehydrogenase